MAVEDGLRSMIEITNLNKSYPAAAGAVRVLRGVNWRVGAGESVAVIGPSGCGKTTLLNLLGALDRPDEGSVRVGGEEIGRLSPEEAAAFRNRAVGFIFQQHHLLPQLTVLENTLVPRLAGGWRDSAAESTARARSLLERVGLGDRLDHLPWQLSGGEKLRTAVVRALLNPEATDTVADILLELNREEGSTLVVVTHHLGLARRIGRIHELRQGLLREVAG
jgi:predicted ABC-type transport system involved in lysophospholipase L1 biosynthesis ATPase subunit